ncbi:MAG: hypothetical protein LBK59_02440 [Bifidobacteriaceae bacterium]|jgi:hypothetical protein|nr:hypothetical protein [Bifidobacteriaceae bacterium]
MTFAYEGSNESGSGETASEAYDRCYAEHLEDTERVWFHQSIPEGRARDLVFDEFVACLEDAGVMGVTSTHTKEEIVKSIVRQTEGDEQALGDGMICLDDHLVLYPGGMFVD